jgi:hypothetical protein
VLTLLAGYFLVSWLRSRARAVRPASAIVEVLVGASPATTTALIAFILAAAYLPWQMPDWAMVPVFIVVVVAWLWLPFGLLLGLWRLARHVAGRPGRRVAGSVVPRR